MAEEDAVTDSPEALDAPGGPPVRRLVFRLLGFGFLGLALVLAIYGVVAFAAWERGQALAQQNARLALQEQLMLQVELASTDVAQGSFSVARRRLEWILERDPANETALGLQATMEATRAFLLTPTATPTPRPTPDAAQVTAPDASEAARGLAELETLVAAQRWDEAVSAIPAFQARFPGYRRHETDTMLYESYIGLGLIYLNGVQVELGVYYLEQAQRLGDLPQEVLDQRAWADLYLLGISSYGVNWDRAIAYFRDLCAAAPFYQDSCDRLYQALVAGGDQQAAAGEHCPAAARYTEAWRMRTGELLRSKLDAARDICLQATPTPDPSEVITDTLSFEGQPASP
jgi:tetratricopeptide (TPR) repeat protein